MINNIGTAKLDGKYYEFNIIELLDFIMDTGYKTRSMKVSDLIGYTFDDDLTNSYVKDENTNDEWVLFKNLSLEHKIAIVEEKENRINNSSLEYPIIVILNSEGIYFVVDGNHRLKKASRLGVKEIETYLLTENEILKAFENKELRKIEKK